MLGLLVQGENLEVVEIALAVIAPRSREDLVQRGTTSLLAHCGCGFEEEGLRERKSRSIRPSEEGGRQNEKLGKLAVRSVGTKLKSLQITQYGEYGM